MTKLRKKSEKKKFYQAKKNKIKKKEKKKADHVRELESDSNTDLCQLLPTWKKNLIV